MDTHEIACRLHDKQACTEPITIKNFVIDTIKNEIIIKQVMMHATYLHGLHHSCCLSRPYLALHFFGFVISAKIKTKFVSINPKFKTESYYFSRDPKY